MDFDFTSRRGLVLARVSSDRQAVSLEQQIAEGRSWYEAQGGRVVRDVSDFAASGGSLVRDGLVEVLQLYQSAARPFDDLVIREGWRVGRHAARSIVAFEDIIQEGVRVFAYSTSEEIRLDSVMDHALLFMRQFAGQASREDGKLNSRKRAEERFKAGCAVAQAPFGYRLVDAPAGSKGAKLIVPDPDTAPWVVRVWKETARGLGSHAIARLFNKPEVGAARCGSWTDTKVRRILEHPIYAHGVVTFGQLGRRDPHGDVVREVRDLDDPRVLSRVDPELIIVPPDLAAKARAVRERAQERYGKNGPTARQDRLLSGLMACPEGHAVTVVYSCCGPNKTRLGCGMRRSGKDCVLTMTRPATEIEAAVAGAVAKAFRRIDPEAVVSRLRVRLAEAEEDREPEHGGAGCASITGRSTATGCTTFAVGTDDSDVWA